VYTYAVRRHCCGALAGRWPSFRPDFTCLLPCDCWSRDRRVQMVGVISGHFPSQTLLNKDQQCCESWREVELRVQAVCAVSDTTDEDWVSLLCCLPHCDFTKGCLANDDWMWLRRLTLAITDHLLPVLRHQQSVLSVSSTTPCVNVLTACC